MGISFVNDREGNNESDITIKNLEETTKRIGFEKQKIYTDHDMPWICFSIHERIKRLQIFCYESKGNNKSYFRD